jgi:hypothetical protein
MISKGGRRVLDDELAGYNGQWELEGRVEEEAAWLGRRGREVDGAPMAQASMLFAQV